MAEFETEWAAWCRRFDDAGRGVYTLFHVRWMWRVVEGISRHAHPDGYTELDNYLARTAIDSLALGVEGEIKTRFGQRHPSMTGVPDGRSRAAA